jgi:hypothetical protein
MLALLAVCLPPLSGMRRARPVERMIRSVQSKLSLRSDSSTKGTARPSQKIEDKGVVEEKIGVLHNVVITPK